MACSQLSGALHDRVQDIGARPVAGEVLVNRRARNVRHALRPGWPQVSLPEPLAIVDGLHARSPSGASVVAALRETS